MILGQDFLMKTGITIDITNGGYSEAAFSPLKPFISPPAHTPATAEKASDPCGVQCSEEIPRSVRSAFNRPRWDRSAKHEEALHPLIANAVDLDHAQQVRLTRLLNRYDEIFTERPGCTDLVTHRIETGDALPLKCNPRPISLTKRQATDKLLDEMLADGVIRRSRSAWASPIVLVLKKDGTYRLCVDYRRLNGLTRKDAYPLPAISSVVGNLGGARYFTTLDASKG